MQTLRQLQAAPLPEGCAAVDISDNVAQWSVTLVYEHGLTVSVKLLFEEGSTRMPKVFVIQPRLKADFIHHGAVCARDLFATSWELTLESITMLILSLHVTLDPAQGSVTVDAEGAPFSDVDHQLGAQKIIEMHRQETRPEVAVEHPPASPRDADASLPAGSAAQAVVLLTTPTLLLQRVSGGGNFQLPASIHVDSLRIDLGVQVTLIAPAGSAVRVTVARSLVIEERALLRLDGITLVVEEQIHCHGRMEVHGETVEGGIVLDRNGTLQYEDVLVRGHVAVLDNAAAVFTDCTVLQVAVEATKEGLAVQNTAAMFAGNNASMTLTRCTVTPITKTTRCGIRGEQHATVTLESTLVLCGFKCCIHLLGGAGTFTRCVFADPAGAGLALSSPKEKRTSGVFVERAKCSLVSCSVFQAYFGFILLDKSVCIFDDCFSCSAVNSFTVDASTAVVHHCHALGEHVGIFVLNGGKCTVGAPRCSDAQFAAARQSNPSHYVNLAIAARSVLALACSVESFATHLRELLTHQFMDPLEEGPCVLLYGRYGIEASKSSCDVSMTMCIGAQEDGVLVNSSEAQLNHVSVVFRPLQAGIVVQNPKTDKNTGVNCKGASKMDATNVDVCGYMFAFFDTGAAADVKHVLATVEEWNATHLYSYCSATECANGFTIDGGIARIENCMATTRSVAVYALNNSQVRVRGAHPEGKYSGDRYGVEAMKAILTVENIEIDAKQLSYVVRGEGGRLRATGCAAVKRDGALSFVGDEGRIKMADCIEISASNQIA
jgi:hypothetical protein